MNLPNIFDIVIGLFFIFLILSLLVSEIQELTATLLQWRAKHLKKAIESILAGGSESGDDEIAKVKQLANRIYSDPLINTLNHEAQGPIASWFRHIVQACGSVFFKLYCSITKKDERQERIFGDRNSGPSYMQAETFSTTLLETLKIPTLIQRATGKNLEKFCQERLENLETLYQSLVEPNISEDNKNVLGRELNQLKNRFNIIVEDLKNNKATLNVSLDRMEEIVKVYIENIEPLVPKNGPGLEFINQIKALKSSTFSPANKDVLLKALQRSLTEILQDYRQIKDAVQYVTQDEGSPSTEKLKEIYQDYQAVYGNLEDVIDQNIIQNLPKSILNSLSVLANRTRTKIYQIEDEVQQFRQEIETWFDRSMDRSSGVYKRNAKGFAILIGLLVASSTNADTFHIASRISKDSALRSAITQNSQQIASGCPTPQSQEDTQALGCIRDRVDEVLTPISLPFGWDGENLRQQTQESQGWKIYGIDFGFLKRILGWIVSGIAIAMGAPFWFDMLNKVINVRNAGPKPASSTEKQSASNAEN